MNNLKENRKFLAAPVAVTLFFLFRSLLLTERSYIGFQDLYAMKFAFSDENIVLVVLLGLFAVLAGITISKISKKFGEASTFLSVLLVAEPFLFAKQMNCVVVFIAVLALLFILNAFGKKRIIPNEAALIVFLVVSCVLTENAIFLFVFPAVILYFVGEGESLFKSVKKIIMIILSAVSVGAGMMINNYLMKNNIAFKEFIKTYSFFRQIYFKHIDYENILLFVFAIPTTVMGCCFLIEFIKNCDKKNKNMDSYVAVILTLTAYILSIAGFVLKGSAAFYTINYIMPSMIFALIAKKNQEAEISLRKVNDIISKHSLAFVTIVVFLYFVATFIFYKDADNLAGYILAI